jgi:hypothetical protein
MPREQIPEAKVGAAPGLEIKQHAGRVAASEGGESTHSMALTYLSSKRLEGLPVAQKQIDGNHKYFDCSGIEISLKQASLVADGAIFYQDPTDPRKGRIRRRGSFFSEDGARTILENSRAGTDVANMRDLDGLPAFEEDLHTIKEDGKEFHQSYADKTPTTEKQRICGFMQHLIIPVLLLAIAASFLSMSRHDVAPFGSGHQVTIGHTGQHYVEKVPLGEEIASLLKADEMGEDEVSRALLDMPQVAEENHPSRQEQEQQASAEIDRILSCRTESDILGPGSLSQQQREFHRIALLLHPDKGLVSAGDERAGVALRLIFAARRRAVTKR